MKGALMELLDEFYGLLSDDKIKINWNKKPIRMDIFLSFLKVPVEKTTDHLGYGNGWTKRQNKELKLIIGGGIVNGTEYLDTLKYKEKLANSYNNFVNPFYLWDILTDQGIDFFKRHYKHEIAEKINKAERQMEAAKAKLDELTAYYDKINGEN